MQASLKENQTGKDEGRAARIAALEARLNLLAGGSFVYHMKEDSPDWMREAFLRRVLEVEECKTTYRLFDLLKADGVPLPDPKGLKDRQLSLALKEMIEGLADRGTFLVRTDHLSERELYEKLWSDLLRQEDRDTPPPLGSRDGPNTITIDILGGCSEEDLLISETYYEDCLEQDDDHSLPPRKKLPYDRDRFLPRAPHDR